MAWQVASLASIVASYFVALHVPPAARRQFINASPPWNMFLSMLILFLGTALVVWIGFNLVAELIEQVKLKEFDRQLGAMFGAAKGVLLCVLITLFSVALLSEPQRQAICNSKSGYYIAVLLDQADAVIPSELHQVLDPYIDRLDQQVPHEHTEGGFGLPAESWHRPAGSSADRGEAASAGQPSLDTQSSRRTPRCVVPGRRRRQACTDRRWPSSRGVRQRLLHDFPAKNRSQPNIRNIIGRWERASQEGPGSLGMPPYGALGRLSRGLLTVVKTAPSRPTC